MDSLTQIALGASIGVAVMGRRTAAWKAALWGGVAGLLPDLDALIDHGDPVLNMVLHRAETHALFWLALASWPLAWLVACMMENLHLRQVNETASKIMPATKRSEIRRGRLGRHASSLGRMKCPNELPPMSLSLQARCRTTLLRLLKCESATRLEKERFAGRCLIHCFSFVRCIR